MTNEYTGSELVDFLRDEEAGGSGAEFVALAKASDRDDHVALSPSMSCDHWVDVPVYLINRAEVTSRQRCKDHSHTVARIRLEKPKSSEDNAFADLLSSMVRSLGNPIPAVTTPVPIRPSWGALRPIGDTACAPYCYTVCMGNTMWCICQDEGCNQWSEPCGSCGDAHTPSFGEFGQIPRINPRFPLPEIV